MTDVRLPPARLALSPHVFLFPSHILTRPCGVLLASGAGIGYGSTAQTLQARDVQKVEASCVLDVLLLV